MSETVYDLDRGEAQADPDLLELDKITDPTMVGHVAGLETIDWAADVPDEPFEAEGIDFDAGSDAPAAQRSSGADVRDIVKIYLSQIGEVPLLSANDEVELSKWIEAGKFAEHRLDQADEGGIELTDTERDEHEQMVAVGQQSFDHMVKANLRLVVSVAKRYTGRGMSFLDLIQEGNLGMIRAVEKFDYQRGYKFSTYATWWIKQSVSRALHDQGRPVRLPVHVGEKINKMLRVERKLLAGLDREPTLEEVAAECEMETEEVVRLRLVDRKVASLDMPLGDEKDARFGDLIEDIDAPTLDSLAEHNERRERVREILGHLSERESVIVSRRFGIEDGRMHTLEEVGRYLGMTRERVRQLQEKAMRRLQKGGQLHNLVSDLEELVS